MVSRAFQGVAFLGPGLFILAALTQSVSTKGHQPGHTTDWKIQPVQMLHLLAVDVQLFKCSRYGGRFASCLRKRHNEIKKIRSVSLGKRSALHLWAMPIQKRSIPTTGALGCSPATPAPQRLYVESDCPTVTAPVQQSQGCHSSRWPAIRPAHRSHGAHSLHTPRIHLAHEIHEGTRDPKSFFSM